MFLPWTQEKKNERKRARWETKDAPNMLEIVIKILLLSIFVCFVAVFRGEKKENQMTRRCSEIDDDRKLRQW